MNKDVKKILPLNISLLSCALKSRSNHDDYNYILSRCSKYSLCHDSGLSAFWEEYTPTQESVSHIISMNSFDIGAPPPDHK
jgi:hypothetical protein